ncbi:MAG: hypothetical protein AAFZ07_23325 [Actinomycetota bacterium]
MTNPEENTTRTTARSNRFTVLNLLRGDSGRHRFFAFDAEFQGSLPGVLEPGQRLNAPVVGAVPFGRGYLMVASDGGVFNFSDQEFLGSLGDNPPPNPVTAIVGYPT